MRRPLWPTCIAVRAHASRPKREYALHRKKRQGARRDAGCFSRLADEWENAESSSRAYGEGRCAAERQREGRGSVTQSRRASRAEPTDRRQGAQQQQDDK